MMTSPTPNQASGSDHTEKAPVSDPTVQEKGSEHIEKVQGSHNTEQAQGPDHTEQSEERDSSPLYETSPSDISDPRIERNARREYARDPDYNPEIEEVNYSFIIICFYTFMRLIHNYMSLYE